MIKIGPSLETREKSFEKVWTKWNYRMAKMMKLQTSPLQSTLSQLVAKKSKIFKAITVWSCNNSKALVKILEGNEIKRVSCLRSSIFLMEKMWVEKILFLLSCFKLQNWLLTPCEREVKYTQSGVKWNACSIKEIHVAMNFTSDTCNHLLSTFVSMVNFYLIWYIWLKSVFTYLHIKIP